MDPEVRELVEKRGMERVSVSKCPVVGL